LIENTPVLLTCPPGSISIAVDRLVRKGLVARRDEVCDRRVRRVELTAEGRTLITAGFREHAAAMEQAVSILSTRERLTLLRLLKKLGMLPYAETLMPRWKINR